MNTHTPLGREIISFYLVFKEFHDSKRLIIPKLNGLYTYFV